MSELSELMKQKALLEAQINKIKEREIGDLKSQFAQLALQLRELNALPESVAEAFTDKSGTFNAYRTMKVKRPRS